MLEETTAYDFCINNANTENGGLGATALIMPDEKFTFEQTIELLKGIFVNG